VALDRIDLTVPEQSIVALVGPNGAGKSTLIRCFVGFERPTAGRVAVMGIDPQRNRSAALAMVGYVAQRPGLYDQLSVREHTLIARSLWGGFDDRATLDRLGRMGIMPERPVHTLSGGQRAQVALALALGTHAPVLLLDEPLSDLDPLARREFLSAVRDAANEVRSTVLIASHIVGELESICTRIVVLAPARVMLNENVTAAKAAHVIRSDDYSNAAAIGVYLDEHGHRRALMPGTYDGDVASLEDIVLGYLAAAKQPTSAAAIA
jgi:ABC-2 type transport system ATP-binding protein